MALASGLPVAQRFPWDQSKGVYLLNGHHNLHCIVSKRTISPEESHLIAAQSISLKSTDMAHDEKKREQSTSPFKNSINTRRNHDPGPTSSTASTRYVKTSSATPTTPRGIRLQPKVPNRASARSGGAEVGRSWSTGLVDIMRATGMSTRRKGIYPRFNASSIVRGGRRIEMRWRGFLGKCRRMRRCLGFDWGRQYRSKERTELD